MWGLALNDTTPTDSIFIDVPNPLRVWPLRPSQKLSLKSLQIHTAIVLRTSRNYKLPQSIDRAGEAENEVVYLVHISRANVINHKLHAGTVPCDFAVISWDSIRFTLATRCFIFPLVMSHTPNFSGELHR